MLRKHHPVVRCCAIVLSWMAFAASASAQNSQSPPPPKSGGDTSLSADLVKTGLYVIRGGGANTLVRFSASGLIVVDGKAPGNYRALMSQVRKLAKFGDLPVRVLVVTDHHDARTGNNAQFLAAGVPIVAQDNVKRNLATAGADAKSGPTVLYERDYLIKLGGVETRLVHFGNAHTNGDTVVYFPNLKVVALGDLYTAGTPDPDFASGGSLVNWGPVLSEVLKLDFDIAVPGAGPMVRKDDVEAFKAKIDTAVSRAVALAKQGVAKDRLMAELRTDDLGWRLAFTGDDLDRFYRELTQAP